MKKTLASLLFAGAAVGKVYFEETFDDASYAERWVSSGDGKFVHNAGKFYGSNTENMGLQTSQDARFYHTSAHFEEFSNEGKTLVLSFSVKHEQNIDCGGGYLKYLKSGFEQSKFNGDTEYNVMFGPDICGATKKVHVILNYKGKNVLTNKNIPAKTDEFTHFYTLILNPDNTYEVQIDGEKVESGKLEDDFDFLPPKEIKDPEKSKPADWVDEAMIDDPEDVKPEGYDDIPEEIVDPDAEKPDDWDDEDDGEWEAPVIPNPEYKGPWSPKRIPNPEYKGEWVHPMIPNPEYAPDSSIYSFSDFAGVGIDIWQVKSGSIFDNIIISDDVDEVNAFIKKHDNRDDEKASFDAQEAVRRKMEEADKAAAEAAAEAEDDEDDDDDDDDDVDEVLDKAKEEL
jgi:calreticulin